MQDKHKSAHWALLCFLRVAGAGIEPASGGSFTHTVSSTNGLSHDPRGILPL